MKKNKAGQDLAHERWKKSTPEQKELAVKKMNKARLVKLKTKRIYEKEKGNTEY